MKKQLIVFLALSTQLSFSIFASEPDNFTARKMNIKDSTTWLNKKMNDSLDVVAYKTHDCNPYKLQLQLFSKLGGVFFAEIESWSKENPNAIMLPIEKSIYADVANVRGDHGLRKFFKFNAYYTEGQMKANNIIIGDDKLGHFLQLGYSMFYAVNKKKNPNFPDIRNPMEKLAEVMAHDYKYLKQDKNTNPNDIVADFANFQEDDEWGMRATMVKSYGDIAANYHGYLFWSQLTEGDNPYFKCDSNDKYKRVRDFKWEDYITPAWDEAINCSVFHPAIKESVEKNIVTLNLGACPIEPTICASLVDSYGSMASQLLNPKCYEEGLNTINSLSKISEEK